MASIGDPAIRKALRPLLTPPAPARWVEEMALVEAGVRVDAAVIGTELVGIEIKSEVDTLARLHNQAREYARVFDKLVLVAAPSHIRAAEQWLPRYWGLMAAVAVDSAPVFRVERPATPNPDQDTAALLALLWRQELVTLATAYAVPAASRVRMRRQLQHLPTPAAADYVRECLRKRNPREWLCRRPDRRC